MLQREYQAERDVWLPRAALRHRRWWREREHECGGGVEGGWRRQLGLVGVAWVGRAGDLRFWGVVRGGFEGGFWKGEREEMRSVFFERERTEVGLHERLFSLF